MAKRKSGGGGRGVGRGVAQGRGGLKTVGSGRDVRDGSEDESVDNEWSKGKGIGRGGGGYDESDEEVFDLSRQNDDESMSESDGEDDPEDDDEGSSVEDDSEDDGESYQRTDLDQLVDQLPSDIRQKVLRGQQAAEDDDSDEESDEDSDMEASGGWGKKSNYYSGDTADLEIGQDVNDAEDEELAVHELRKEQLARRQEEDYAESSSSDREEEIPESSKQLTKQLEKMSRSQGGKVVVEKLERDIKKLSKKQRMDIIKSESPEMLGLVEELNEKLKDLRERIDPMKKALEKVAPVEDELVKYLEVKQQILLSYCINIVFYLMLKAEGASVQSHPVMKQLLKLRYIMERMRHLDGKMKHQIDRLLSVADDPSALEAMATSSARPNISALMEAAGDEEEDEDSDMDLRSKSKSGVYRAPKTHAVPYKDDKDVTQLEDKIKRKKNKIKNSEILDALREEFGQAPEESSSSGLGKLSKEQQAIDDEIEERRKFEEDRFVRLTLSKKDKKSIKKRREMTFNPSQELVADLGDIDDFESLATLTSNLQSADPNSKRATSSMDHLKAIGGSMNSESLSNALKKAVNVFSKEEKKTKKGGTAATQTRRGGDEEDFSAGVRKTTSASTSRARGGSDDDYSDDGFGGEEEEHMIPEARGSKRRRAPEPSALDDDEDNIFNEFSKKKKEYLSLKQDHYAVEQRTGGHEDDLEDATDKRAATYEIMTNRGLRPHRKKSNRNPRVKKREAFDKAVQKRKSQVREVVGGSTVAYGGEMTGIKSKLSRSRRFES